MRAALAAALAAGLLCLLPAAAGAAWHQPVGGASPINREAARSATEPSLGSFEDKDEGRLVPYLAWSEVDSGGVSQIRAARLNAAGTAWERPGDSASPINLSPTTNAEDPSLRRDDPGDSPCVAFDEASGSGTEIHMSCLTTATSWSIVGDSPDKDPSAVAAEPSLTLFEAITWVAWSEVDAGGVSQIRVAKLPDPGTNWVRVPDTASPINASPDDDAVDPDLVAVGNRLYVSWSEVDAATQVSQVHVARLNATGDDWEQVGGPLNKEASMNAFEPTMADVGGAPYVAWSETNGLPSNQIRVARLNSAGSGWELVADSNSPINEAFNQDAEHPSLTAVGGVPYVSWSEPDAAGHAQVRVARLDAAGSAWEKVVESASPINQSSQLSALEPVLTEIGGFPYIGWSEEDEGGVEQVRVGRLEPEFLTAGAADLAPEGATLSTEVRTYGLPFPIGFEYGTTLAEHRIDPQPAPTGAGEVVTIAKPVTGLSPDTAYQLRPFASAGVPNPLVLGASAGFTTPIEHTLTVTRSGTGTGSVASTPAGIDCGSTCAHAFVEGTMVTLEATPASGSLFTGWSGGGCSGTGPCVVQMSADTPVTASFEALSPVIPLEPSSSKPSSPQVSPAPPPGSSAPPAVALPSVRIAGARVSSRQGVARFRFLASGGAAGFQCSLVRAGRAPAFRSCRSPRVYRRLKPGRYVFGVRVRDPIGALSAPARRKIRVKAAAGRR